MNKKIKALIIGSVVLVVLAAAMVVLLVVGLGGENSSDSSASDSSVSLLEKNVGNIRTLKISNEKGEFELKQNEDNEFSAEDLKGLPADQEEMKTGFSRMAVIDALKVIEGAGAPAEYGLADPAAVITAEFSDGSVHTVKVGIDSPLGDGCYAMIDNDETVYLFSSSYGYYRDYEVKDFLMKTVAVNSEGKEYYDVVQKVSLYRKDLGQELVFEQLEDDPDSYYKPTSTSDFTMTSPIKAYLDTDNVAEVVDPAVSLKANAVVGIFPTQEELREYGLLDPQAVYTAYRLDGMMYQLKIGNACYSDPTTDEEPGSSITGYYVEVVGCDAVYYIRSSSLVFMSMSTFDMLSQISFAPEIVKVDTMTVQAEGAEYLFDFTTTTDDGGSTTTSATVNGKEVDNDKLVNFYVYMVSVLANDLYTTPQTGAPALSLTFQFNDSSVDPLVVTFHDIGDRKASITINGETRFSTRWTYVSSFFSNIKLIANNEAINPSY